MGRQLVLLLSLALAAMVSASTGALAERIEKLLTNRSAATLGADLLLSSRQTLAAEVATEIEKLPLRRAEETVLPTIAFAGELSSLISLRAVGPQWPLAGLVEHAPATGAQQPRPGEIWIDERLALRLGVSAGDVVEIGQAQLRVGAILGAHPGRGNAGFTSLAPQALLRLEDIETTGLLLTGSRARWFLYLSGDTPALSRAREIGEAAGLRVQAPGEARPAIGSALKRNRRLLDLAGLCSLGLLAAVVFLIARTRLPAWEYEVAVLRSLGAPRWTVQKRIALPWLRVTLISLTLGLLLAWLGQWVLSLVLQQRFKLELPDMGPQPFLQAALATLSIAAVAIPQIWRAAETPPAHVLRQAQSPAGSGLMLSVLWTLFCLGCMALLICSEPLLLVGSLAVNVLGAGLLGLLCLLLLRLLPDPGPLSAIGQMRQQGMSTVLQCGALGLGVAILLLLAGLQTQIIAPWQERLPADAPNRFVLNIQPEQQEPLAQRLREAGVNNARIMPMVRGRLVALNGERVRSEDFDDLETQRWIDRDFNLSSAPALPDDNQLLEGRFWEAGTSEPELSVDTYAVERLALELGHTLTLDFAGEERRYTVTSIREVQWDTMQPNFFLLVPPKALPLAQASLLTSYHLPASQTDLDRELIRRYPNLTVLDLDSLLEEIRQITGRALLALQIIFGFTLISGSLLVGTMLLSSLPERRHRAALLRALGLDRKRLRRIVITEFLGLGLLAGLAATLLAQLALGLLSSRAFAMPWEPALWLLLAPAPLAAALTGLMGWALLRSTTHTPPGRMLRED